MIINKTKRKFIKNHQNNNKDGYAYPVLDI